jgi:catechol 2,3-dioxygenase
MGGSVMTDQRFASSFPRFGDVAHLGHIELLTPKPEASLTFFTSVVGLHESGRAQNSVYLRGWGDYEWHTLKLTAYRCATPDGHAIELYWETRRFMATPEVATAFRNQPQRYVPRGIAPRRLDHLNILASEVAPTRRFFHELLGLRLTEQIIFDEGAAMGAWLSATNKSYDVAITHDRTGASGRLHHLTYAMDSREDVLRAADILRDADVPIETGPHKHSIGQTFFLYCYEPGGNRFEIGAGGYLIFDPDWKPVIWTQAERAKGQAWGLQTVSTFHTHGTPPAPMPDPGSR